MSDSTARIVRTIVQLVAGGLLTGLFLQLSHDADPRYAPYLALASTLLVTICQNVAEENGWLKPLLKPADDASERVQP